MQKDRKKLQSRLFHLLFLTFLLNGLFGGFGCFKLDTIAQCFTSDECQSGESCRDYICTNADLPQSCPATCQTDEDCNRTCERKRSCIAGICNENTVWMTSTLSQENSRQIDILFVIDNSGSMLKKQERLTKSFNTFIKELTQKELGDLHIAIVASGSSPKELGKFQYKYGQQPFISTNTLSRPEVIRQFKENISVGVRGSDFEKPLEALKQALSSTDFGQLDFLRTGSLLAIIFVGDEDDCSHGGKINEKEVDSAVCNLPRNEILKDEKGNIVPNTEGKPIHGQFEDLIPVSTYIKFLHGLEHEIVVTGLIGDPVVTLPNTNKLLAPNGCKIHEECTIGLTKRFCLQQTTNQKQCGGCINEQGNASPAFRLYEVIKAFNRKKEWHSICHIKEAFTNSLLNIARNLASRRQIITLHSPPIVGSLSRLKVEILDRSGKLKVRISQAKNHKDNTNCRSDDDCKALFICGTNRRCQGNGWVYFPPFENQKPIIKLSGTARLAFSPQTTIKVTYLTKK